MGADRLLDRIVRRRIRLRGRSVDAYLFFVYAGVVAGTTVVFALSVRSVDVSLPVMAGLVALVAVLSLALFRSTRVLGGSHPFLNWAKRGVYHFQILALVLVVTILEVVREPVLPYLDVLVVAMLVYQAFGRIGCLMAGCCHGRASSWGVRYGDEHAETGYIYFVQGVRLFPVQLVEAVWLFLLAAVGTVIVLRSDEPGESLAWYIVGYGLGRFLLEFLRGDLGRVYLRGFSEPQWTAVCLTAIVVLLELAGVLPFHAWHAGVLVIMAAVVVTLTLVNRRRRGVLRETPFFDLEQVRRTEEQILVEAHVLPAGRRPS